MIVVYIYQRQTAGEFHTESPPCCETAKWHISTVR